MRVLTGRDDPDGLNVPPKQSLGMEYYDSSQAINMGTGKRRGNSLKMLQL